MAFDHSPLPTARDAIAVAIEGHLRSMEDAGYGNLTIDRESAQIVLAFGRVEARAGSYDVALLRLATALLDSSEFCAAFFARMRNPLAVNLRDQREVRKVAGKQ